MDFIGENGDGKESGPGHGRRATGRPGGYVYTWIVTSGALAALKPAAAKVLLALCARSKSGIAFPSLATLVADTGLTRQGALNGIAALEAAGIVAVNRTSKPGRSHVNEYTIKSQSPLTLPPNSEDEKGSTAVAERVNGDSEKGQPPLTRTVLNKYEQQQQPAPSTDHDGAAAAGLEVELEAAGIKQPKRSQLAGTLLEHLTPAQAVNLVRKQAALTRARGKGVGVLILDLPDDAAAEAERIRRAKADAEFQRQQTEERLRKAEEDRRNAVPCPEHLRLRKA